MEEKNKMTNPKILIGIALLGLILFPILLILIPFGMIFSSIITLFNPSKVTSIDNDLMYMAVIEVQQEGVGYDYILSSDDNKNPVTSEGIPAPINIDLLKTIYSLTNESDDNGEYKKGTLNELKNFILATNSDGEYTFINIIEDDGSDEEDTCENPDETEEDNSYSQFKTSTEIINSFDEKTAQLLTTLSFQNAESDTLLPQPKTSFKGKFPLPLDNGNITSYFGWRKLNYKNNFHCGVDFVNGNNHADIKSIADGTVVEIYDTNYFKSNPTEPQNFGQQIVIEHKEKNLGTQYKKFYSVYCHLSNINVIKGQKIKQGQKIGNMGGARVNGLSEVGLKEATTGSHLHFEIRDNFSPKKNYQGRGFKKGSPSTAIKNPLDYLSPKINNIINGNISVDVM